MVVGEGKLRWITVNGGFGVRTAGARAVLLMKLERGYGNSGEVGEVGVSIRDSWVQGVCDLSFGLGGVTFAFKLKSSMFLRSLGHFFTRTL